MMYKKKTWSYELIFHYKKACFIFIVIFHAAFSVKNEYIHCVYNNLKNMIMISFSLQHFRLHLSDLFSIESHKANYLHKTSGRSKRT